MDMVLSFLSKMESPMTVVATELEGLAEQRGVALVAEVDLDASLTDLEDEDTGFVSSGLRRTATEDALPYPQGRFGRSVAVRVDGPGGADRPGEIRLFLGRNGPLAEDLVHSALPLLTSGIGIVNGVLDV